MERFVALRMENVHIDTEKIGIILPELLKTQYSIRAKDEDAPCTTHCISSVRYLISEITGIHLPHAYIGDLIPTMLGDSHLGTRLIDLNDADAGDLVFFHRRSFAHKAYMITHVGIFINGDGDFFHSAYKRGGIIENIQNIHAGKIVTCKMATKLTDPRSKLSQIILS